MGAGAPASAGFARPGPRPEIRKEIPSSPRRCCPPPPRQARATGTGSAAAPSTPSRPSAAAFFDQHQSERQAENRANRAQAVIELALADPDSLYRRQRGLREPRDTIPLPTALAAWSPPPATTGVPAFSPVTSDTSREISPVTSGDS